MSEDDHDFRRCRCEPCREAYAVWFQERCDHEDRMYEMNGPLHE